jgi:hypothetical protein
MNLTDGSVDLNCLTIADGLDHTGYIEGSVVVESGGLAVLYRRTDTPCYDFSAGTPSSDYRSAVSLNNEEDTVRLSYGETTFDTVSYLRTTLGGWPDSVGHSMSFWDEYVASLGISLPTANDEAEYWCDSATLIPGSGDYGTPGAPNDGCI